MAWIIIRDYRFEHDLTLMPACGSRSRDWTQELASDGPGNLYRWVIFEDGFNTLVGYADIPDRQPLDDIYDSGLVNYRPQIIYDDGTTFTMDLAA